MTAILLTQARAQRVVRQYLTAGFAFERKPEWEKSHREYAFHVPSEGRTIVLLQDNLGVFEVREYHGPLAGVPVFRQVYELPAIGPVNFNHPAKQHADSAS